MGFEEDVKKLDIKHIVTGAIITAMGFLCALSWRDAINSFLNTIIPMGEGPAYKFLAAVLITIITIVVSVALIKMSFKSIRKLAKKAEEEVEKIEEVFGKKKIKKSRR